jgi:hypothetical protein
MEILLTSKYNAYQYIYLRVTIDTNNTNPNQII